jgi:hypothetical protein
MNFLLLVPGGTWVIEQLGRLPGLGKVKLIEQ